MTFWPKGGITKTPSGKRQRGRTRTRYERGTLDKNNTGAGWLFAQAALGALRLNTRRLSVVMMLLAGAKWTP